MPDCQKGRARPGGAPAEPRFRPESAGLLSRYRDGAAYCVSSLRMILPPFITNLTR